MTVVIISIPFFVVNFWKKDSNNEINLNYLSNVVVRVKRSSGEVVNVPLEEYVVGVVAGEMPASFELEALKAQSVASRTYVLKKIKDNVNNDYDVLDTVSNQVYLDEDELKSKWGDKYSEYIDRVRAAVKETSMEYLEYGGEIITAMYFSTSNGYTEDSGVFFQSSLPYLKSVDSFWDKDTSSAFKASKNITLSEFYKSLGLNYSDELNIEVIERSSTNRILKIKINGIEFLGKDIYSNLGLKSYDFEI